MHGLTLRRLIRDEQGQALVVVVFLTMVLTLMATLLMQASSSEGSRSSAAVVRQQAHAAAEAGIDDYVTKLLGDNQYFLHYVAPGESTRKSTTNNLVSAVNPPATPTVWPSPYGRSWTYPSKDTWFDLGNDYAYNLQITAPQSGANTTNSVDIVATGAFCKSPCTTPSTTNRRVIEEQIRPASVSDFQMMADASISYGSAASTYGKIYAGCVIAANGQCTSTKYSVDHQGTAYADVYAEGSVTGSPTLKAPPGSTVVAKTYNSSTIRSVIKTPIDFTTFQTSLTDIQRAAQFAGGIYLNDPNVDGWMLTFNSDGTVSIKSCTSNSALQTTQPTCVTAAGYSTPPVLPPNGAIYAEQSVIVSGGASQCGSPVITGSCVKGRVTVASNNDIVIGDDIDYVTSGTDTLGLIAKNTMWVAKWAPANINWRAATIAQSGTWQSYACGYGSSGDGTHQTMNFTGSTATNGGGCMDAWKTRNYNYDTTLSYLQPPWFPTIGSAYTVILYRELPGS